MLLDGEADCLRRVKAYGSANGVGEEVRRETKGERVEQMRDRGERGEKPATTWSGGEGAERTKVM